MRERGGWSDRERERGGGGVREEDEEEEQVEGGVERGR